MIVFLTVVILIVCFLLGAVILVQNPKGGGLATGFQGASQIGGVQRTTNFLEKSTWFLAVALFVLCILVGSFAGNGSLEVGVDESFAPTPLPETSFPTHRPSNEIPNSSARVTSSLAH